MKLLALSCVLAALAASACQSSRDYRLDYTPAPLEVEVGSSAVTGSQVRALATITRVRKQDGDRPAEVQVRMRLENLGSVAGTLVADGFALVSADLVPFGPPSIRPPGDVQLAVGVPTTVDVAFPFPADKEYKHIDWSGLNLRFVVAFEGTRVTTGATFSRVIYYPVEGSSSFSVGFGYWR
jgi:hypothetical protein